MHRYRHQHLTSPCKRLLWGLWFAVACVTAHAQNQATTNSAPSTERSQGTREIADGRATRAWLKAQDTGAQASKHKQTLSGPAMSRVHEHYLNSFSRDSAASAKASGSSTPSKP